MPSRTSRLLFAVLAAGLFVLLLPRAAWAQATITVNNENSLPRLDKNGNTISKRSLTLTPEGVNYQDCVDDQQIDFPIVLAGFVPNASFEAWAGISGADCGVQTNRTSASAVCWQLITGIPLQNTVEVKIPVRKILAGAPPFTAQNQAQGDEVCGKVDLVNVSVQFLYFAPGQAGSTPEASHAVSVSADTLGPPPPTGITVLPGNTRIKVSWDNISGEGGVSALTGVAVYCDPSTGGAAAPADEDAGTHTVCEDAGEEDAGDAGDGGDAAAFGPVDAGCHEEPNEPSGGGGTTGSSGCASANFKNADGSDVIPDANFNAKYQCGGITGNSGTSVNATSVQGNPLANGTSYAVAVAGTDAYGNVGPLSDPICETPEVTTDFWDKYKGEGGGGGGCATAGSTEAGAPAASFAFMAFAAMVAVSFFTKRNKRR